MKHDILPTTSWLMCHITLRQMYGTANMLHHSTAMLFWFNHSGHTGLPVNCAGQKGSDVSAREATKKLVAATKQMHALQAVLQDIHGVTATIPQDTGVDSKLPASDENAKSAAAEAGPWAARNTIVRDVLNELTNAAQKARRTRLPGIPHADKGSPARHC